MKVDKQEINNCYLSPTFMSILDNSSAIQHPKQVRIVIKLVWAPFGTILRIFIFGSFSQSQRREKLGIPELGLVWGP